MQFTVAMTADDAAEIATKIVDTENDLHGPTVLSCDRWISGGGGIKFDPNIGQRVGMRIVHTDDSSAILDFEIEGQIQVVLLLLSGIAPEQDAAAAQQFRELCGELNASVAHAAFQLTAPLAYVICNPLRTDLPETLVSAMVTLCDHFSAALLNHRGRPV